MNNHWQSIPLGNVLTERREKPSEEDLATGSVRIVSKIGFNDGEIQLREDSKTRTGMILIRPGDLVVSGINAAKGAIAVYSEDKTDPIAATIHYGAYIPNRNKVDIKYLWWLLRSNTFRDLLNRYVPGGIKTELKAKRLLPIPVPLPSFPKQQRIVARIESLVAIIEEARRLRRQTTEEIEALQHSIASTALSCDGNTTVGDFAKIQSGYAFKSEWFTEDGIRLVRNVNIGHGQIEWDQAARIPDSRRDEFSAFDLVEGDILVSLDRPIISTGVKVARVGKRDLPSLLLQRVGRIRFTSEAVTQDFLFAWLRSTHFINAIDPGRSNGVPHISPKDIERLRFAPPSLAEQRRIVSYLEGVTTKVAQLKRQQAETATELDALLPSVLDKAFKGEL